MLSGAALNGGRIAALVAEMIAATGAGLEGARPELFYEMRYAGQAFELPVPGDATPDPLDLIERFEQAHEQRYGHRDPGGEVVLVDVRLAMVVPAAHAAPRAAGAGALEKTSRPVLFDGAWLETTALRGEPAAGTSVEGPVVFELPEATFVLPPGWSAQVDEHGTIVAGRDNRAMRGKVAPEEGAA
jgi:N-methylhydantoinase A